MKVLYRCPYKIQPWMLALITFVAVALLAFVETSTDSQQQKMRQAVELNIQGQNLVAARKSELGLDNTDAQGNLIHPMLGSWHSTPVTSIFGHLSAKQASTNPHFAALVYKWLVDAGVQKGDIVAVSASGSFPALNMATYAALQTLEAKPLIILSLTASQWGANQPQMMWIDMGQVLYQQELVDFKPIAVSYGAKNDIAQNISPEGISLLQQAIARNDNPPLILTSSLMGNIEQKWQLYQQYANNQPIKAFINIGGGKSSTGSIVDKKQLFKPGLNLSLPTGQQAEIPALMWRFISDFVPVIHLSSINKIVAANDLDKQSKANFYRQNHNKPLYSLIGVIVLIALLAAAAVQTRRLDTQESL